MIRALIPTALGAALLAHPVHADGLWSFLSPGDLAEEMGLADRAGREATPDIFSDPAVIAAPDAALALRAEPGAPMARPDGALALLDAMDEAARAAPPGANTLVLTREAPARRPWWRRLFGG